MNEGPRRDVAFWLVVGACCVLLCFSITNVSLWIDEGYTAWLVAHPSIGSVVAALASHFQATAADRQYPLYVLWIWTWAHVFGSSEVALRSSNVPFGVLYVLALALPCRYVFKRRFAWVPFAFAPFIWFYMNEARSYLMLASLATAATAAAIAYAYGPLAFRPRAAWLLGGFSLLALLTNILAVFLFAGLAVFAILALRGPTPRWREWLLPMLVVGPLIVLTLAFYAFTFLGAGGRGELQSNHRDVASVAFSAEVLYEDAGFDGLGPPRNALRVRPTTIAVSYAVCLLLGAAALALALLLALRKSRDPRFLPLLLGWTASFALSVAVSYVLHTRFLGRHMAGAFPLLMFALIPLLQYRVQLALVAAIFVLSDVRLAVLPQYWKDDYRAAVRDVITRAKTTGCTIDWAADDRTANYYGLALAHPGHDAYGRYLRVGWPEKARGVAVSLMRPDAVDAMLTAQLAHGKPVCLALSKLDVFDSNSGWQDAVDRYRPAIVAKHRAFTIYFFSSVPRR